MNTIRFRFLATLTITVQSFVFGVAFAQSPKEKLAAHTDEFRREVIEVTAGVHVAVGFGLANSILIEGDDGVIIVDTMESPKAAAEVKAEFDKITSKPVNAIIYTHNHYDHIYGATVFAGDDAPEVYAQELLAALETNRTDVVQPAIFLRSARQFGVPLPQEGYLNAGIGPRLNLGPGGVQAYISPTQTFSDRAEYTVAGVRFVLQHAPGETDDQLYVWLPDKKVLLPGDNYYHAFPNLYAIRGTRYRNVLHWADSLDKMIGEEPAFLVPSHTRPVVGTARIAETLGNYRDAIRYVHDETIKGMNAGRTPDELAHSVRLPDRLASQPYLTEFYGTVSWSVRAIFAGNLGWFDGNATNLFRLAPADRGQRMIDLVGGKDALVAKARAALDSGDAQWACELVDHLLVVEPGNAAARGIKVDALTLLADGQVSANGRNYYLTRALQLR